MSVDTFKALMDYLAKWFETLMKMFAQIKDWFEKVTGKLNEAE